MQRRPPDSSAERASAKFLDGWTIVVCIAACLAVASFGVFAPAPRLIATFHDDAFYYLQVARNVAAGRGFTFDGVHATNGFHPLWLFVLVPVFSVTSGDVTPLRVVAGIESALVASAVVLTFRTLRARVGDAAAAAGALSIVALPGAPATLRGGMEGGLLLTLLVLAWGTWPRSATAAPIRRRALMFGAICAAASLTRLEASALAGVCAVVALRRWHSRSVAIAIAAPAAVCLAAYFVWNQLAFGTWLPVSGLTKAVWASALPLSARLEHGADLPWLGVYVGDLALRAWSPGPAMRLGIRIIPLASLVVAAWVCRHRVRLGAQRVGGLPVTAALAAVVVFDTLALGGITEWQRVPIVLLTALALATALAVDSRWVTLAAAATVAACAARPWVARARDGSAVANAQAAAAAWLAQNVREDEVVGSYNAGFYGYFVRRTVINLDGLANDAEFFREVVLDARFDVYFQRERVRWLIDDVCGMDQEPLGFRPNLPPVRLLTPFERATVFPAANARLCPIVVWRRTLDAADERRPQR